MQNQQGNGINTVTVVLIIFIVFIIFVFSVIALFMWSGVFQPSGAAGVSVTNTQVDTLGVMDTQVVASAATSTQVVTPAATSTQLDTPVATSTYVITLTPTASMLSSDDNQPFHQVGVIRFTHVYAGPSADNTVLRNLFAGGVYPILTTVKDRSFYSVWLEETQSAGWVSAADISIDPRIDIQRIPLDPRYYGEEHGPTPTAGPVATLTPASESQGGGPTPSSPLITPITPIGAPISDCDLAVIIDLTSSSGDFLVKWGGLPAKANSLLLSVVSTNSDRANNIPLIMSNPMDKFAMNQGVFLFPRTRFDERGYEVGDEFVVTLMALDINKQEICPASHDYFTWLGQGR